MIKYACCPTIGWNTFIVWVSVIDVIYFLISLILTWASKQQMDPNSEFLQPNLNVLNQLGMRNTWLMHQGQVWRFLTPLILHANLLHIVSNVCIQLMMVQLETSIGTKRTIGLYFISGVGGILFSSLINDNLSVGASTAIMGLVAGYLGYIMLNWDALERFGCMRCFMLFQIFFMILITFMVGIGFASDVDNYGHLGGLIMGFFGSIVLIKPILNRSYEKNLRLFASFVVLAFFLIGFCCFYLTRHPVEIY
jgi:rhomboid protease GluP